MILYYRSDPFSQGLFNLWLCQKLFVVNFSPLLDPKRTLRSDAEIYTESLTQHFPGGFSRDVLLALIGPHRDIISMGGPSLLNVGSGNEEYCERQVLPKLRINPGTRYGQ